MERCPPRSEAPFWPARIDLPSCGREIRAAAGAASLCRCVAGASLLTLAVLVPAGCSRSTASRAESPLLAARIATAEGDGWSAQPSRSVDLGSPTLPRLIEPQVYRGTG